MDIMINSEGIIDNDNSITMLENTFSRNKTEIEESIRKVCETYTSSMINVNKQQEEDVKIEHLISCEKFDINRNKFRLNQNLTENVKMKSKSRKEINLPWRVCELQAQKVV